MRRRIAIMAFLWSKLLEESGMDLNIESPTASLTSDSQKDDLIGVNIGTEVGMKVIITWSTICIIPFWWFRYARSNICVILVHESSYDSKKVIASEPTARRANGPAYGVGDGRACGSSYRLWILNFRSISFLARSARSFFCTLYKLRA